MLDSDRFSCPIIDWHTADNETRGKILSRSQLVSDSIESEVRRWIERIAGEGDAAVVDYIRQYDQPHFTLREIRVSETEISQAYRNISAELLAAIREQITISRRFHEELRERICMEWSAELIPGVITGFRREPIEAVGLYVPAGKAPLPTVAQILTVAARSAGVNRVVVTFPPTADHAAIIVAANEAGAHEIYRVGGIAAIASLALGTESIAAVQKIAGPGNPYVQVAKLLLSRQVGIDMFSGPSEAIIMADERANPAYLAADMLARCEHGPDSAAVVVTNCRMLPQQILTQLDIQANKLSRQSYIRTALARYSAIVLVDSEEEMVEFVNHYAPEHLEIQVQSPERIFKRIKNAGSTFLGAYAPVAVGDYASGTNHCLPTGRAVKFSSPISPETFLKTLQFQSLSDSGLSSLASIVQTISRTEGLDAHERSVTIRFD